MITPDTRAYRYQCSGGQTFEVEYSLELATVVLNSETVQLAQIPAASGARYSDGTMTLHTKGEEAFIEMGDQIIYEDCMGERIAISEIRGAERDEDVVEAWVARQVTFVCDDNLTFEVEFTPEQATVLMADEALVLSQIPSASGAQYSDGQTLLATRGDAAFVEVEGEMVYENCLAQAETPEGAERAIEESSVERSQERQTQQTPIEPAPSPALSSPPSDPEASPETRTDPVRALW
jgi:membrane-bound inhibitor of C-type lysozyme